MNTGGIDKYLSRVSKSCEHIAQDMTLAEHDLKYHNGNYTGGPCKYRENIRKKQIRNSYQQKLDFSSYEQRVKKWLANATIHELSVAMHKWDDDKHPLEMQLWKKEIDKREADGIDKHLRDLGEQV